MKKYLLALDIDGTITDELHKIPSQVIAYLKNAEKDGAIIAFVTGRFFPFAMAHLENLPFPYFLATQNGAQIFSMPEQKILNQFFLSKNLVLEIDHIGKNFPEDFIVYTDQSYQYKTFYREGKFSPKVLEHILKLESMAYHPFVKLDCFTNLPLKAVPCLKHFGTFEQIKPLYDLISLLPVQQTLIQDPTNEQYCMNLVTHHKASKGEAVGQILHYLDINIPVIGAGNDRNDMSLLEKSDLGICVGKDAPAELIQKAKMHAPQSGLFLLSYLEQAKKQLGF